MSGVPVKTIERSDVFARVVQVLGNIKVNGWTNGNRSNSFWSSILYSSRPLGVAFPSNFAIDAYNNFVGGGNASEFFANWYVHGGGADSINSNYFGSANSTLTNLITSITAIDQPPANIANWLNIGANTISYEVAPISAVWSVEFQLYTKDANGGVNFIQQTQLSNSNPTQTQPIPLVVISTS